MAQAKLITGSHWPFTLQLQDNVHLRQIVLSDWFRAKRCWQAHSSHADPLSSLLPWQHKADVQSWAMAGGNTPCQHVMDSVTLDGRTVMFPRLFSTPLLLVSFSAQLLQRWIFGVISDWQGLCSSVFKKCMCQMLDVVMEPAIMTCTFRVYCSCLTKMCWYVTYILYGHRMSV